MPINRDWHDGTITLDDADDVALAVRVAGESNSFTLTAGGVLTAASMSVLSLGAAEEATVAEGVLTVTQTYVNVLPETSTTDQVDTITMTPTPTGGELLLLTSKATNTITVDDANVNLGAATRAIAPGGSLLLYFDGDEWTELVFLAGSDNS